MDKHSPALARALANMIRWRHVPSYVTPTLKTFLSNMIPWRHVPSYVTPMLKTFLSNSITQENTEGHSSKFIERWNVNCMGISMAPDTFKLVENTRANHKLQGN